MTRWAPDAALRLEAAALDLVEEQGYAATTVPQITARAELTTRTFFRHFADKRDVFFLRDREFPRVIAEALEGVAAQGDGLGGVSAGADALDVVRQGLARAVSPLEGWREPILRRRAIIRAEDQLRERELLKSAHLADAITDGLVLRSVAPERARLVASIAVLVFDRALDAWLDAPPTRPLAGFLEDSWVELEALLAPQG
ncbi:TetR/AcrR family transcriptional regulator [Herbiconiux sp. VKM Ac-2851]|uniref:TetR/AcrR family transcriptional regulator n=1 Tax=Herbiconiux sp. VKM Ac-2851 TaxID=2739025 RepID=UPI001565C8D6|nr:TetR/AcrR family transcriptional regulator [Herbiconiux sp. VKM Ac-2851]NQX33548.1 helix-turn-helix transcriptional regulator [Herbiconiux sp. VKM Ac-2851]